VGNYAETRHEIEDPAQKLIRLGEILDMQIDFLKKGKN